MPWNSYSNVLPDGLLRRKKKVLHPKKVLGYFDLFSFKVCFLNEALHS